jgi:hypothetical protein
MPNFLPSHYAEFQAPVSTGGVFYAAWPRNASSRDLRAINGMLTQTLEWWADKLAAVEKGNAEYDSWLINPLGVALPDGGQHGTP